MYNKPFYWNASDQVYCHHDQVCAIMVMVMVKFMQTSSRLTLYNIREYKFSLINRLCICIIFKSFCISIPINMNLSANRCISFILSSNNIFEGNRFHVIMCLLFILLLSFIFNQNLCMNCAPYSRLFCYHTLYIVKRVVANHTSRKNSKEIKQTMTF